MSTDPLWVELRRRAERFGPRYDTKYGTCRSCGLGFITMVPLGDVSWGICNFCATADPVGVDLFDLPPIDPEIYEYCLHLIGENDVSPQPNGERFIMLSKKSSSVQDDARDARFDPWPDACFNPKSDDENPDEAPDVWHRFTSQTRERLGLILTEQNAAAIPAMLRLRARWLPAKEMGESMDRVAALEPLFINDPIERAKWRAAEEELFRLCPDIGLFFWRADRKLRAVGDVVKTLRARRDAIDKQIARLEQRHGACSEAR